MIKKSWKVYDREGHRQRMSFDGSVYWDWSYEEDDVRIFEAINADLTNTNEYTIVRITRDTEELCDDDFFRQLQDGYFENSSVGKTEVISVEDLSNKKVSYKLNKRGKEEVEDYIRELEAKRKEILDAGKDTSEETSLPTSDDIEADITFTGIDDDGEYYNGWPVTDHYDADRPILLKINRDFDPVYVPA